MESPQRDVIIKMIDENSNMHETDNDSINHSESPMDRPNSRGHNRQSFSKAANGISFISQLSRLINSEPNPNADHTEETHEFVVDSDAVADHQSEAGDGAEGSDAEWESRQRAPTMQQLYQGVLEDGDNEIAKYASIMIRVSPHLIPSSPSAKSPEDLAPAMTMADIDRIRIDDMTFEQIEKTLRELGGTPFRSLRGDTPRRIELNRYPLDLRYRLERELLPVLVARMHAAHAEVTILFSDGSQPGIMTSPRSSLPTPPTIDPKQSTSSPRLHSFLDNHECYLEFHGGAKGVAETLCSEVRQFLEYAPQNDRPDFLRDLEFHDLLSFSDITKNMLDKSRPQNDRPFIKVRKHTVLISMGILRCIICLEPIQLYLLFGLDDDVPRESGPGMEQASPPTRAPIHEASVIDTVHLMQATITAIAHSNRNKDESFEHHAYRAILTYTNITHENYVRSLSRRAEDTIEQFKGLGYVVSNDHFEDLQAIKKQCEAISRSLSSHRQCIEELLDQPILMAMMCLTLLRKEENVSVYKTAESSPQAIMCNAAMLRGGRQVERIFVVAWEKIRLLEEEVSSIDSSIDDSVGQVIKASKDSQTTVLVVNTCLTVFATFAGLSGYMTGAFGMNLDQTSWLQEEPGVFQAVCVATFVFIGVGSPGLIFWLLSSGYLPSTRSTKELVKARKQPLLNKTRTVATTK